MRKAKISSASYGRAAPLDRAAVDALTAHFRRLPSNIDHGTGPSSPISPALYRQARAIMHADAHPSALRVDVDVRLVSEANARGHWARGAGRAHGARAKAFQALEGHGAAVSGWVYPLIICLTRIGPRMLDGDNAERSCKSLRDGVADWLGRDDGDESLTWLVQQARGPYGARIEMWRWEP